MDISNNIGKKLLTLSAASFVVLFSHYSIAGISGDGYWLVKSGDSVYSIARNVFPDDKVKRQQFRKQLIEKNTAIFKGNPAIINIGDKLALPAFVISKPVKNEEKIAPVQAKVVSAPAEAEKKVIVTADPEEVIGRVIISVGKMQASNRGTFRKLQRNSKIFKGDTLKTAANAYTQVRMKDGALLSLRPNTELVITDYNFDGKEDGTEKSFMELLQGGFRTITGYIGHKNKRSYRVKTSVATIGIRGTHYGLMICSDGSCSNEAEPLEDGVYGGVVDGSINVSNDSGDYTFNNDQFFHVASATTAAVELLVPPPVFHGSNDRVYSKKESGTESKRTAVQHESNKGKKPEVTAAFSGKEKLFPGEAGTKKARSNQLGTLVKSYIESKPPPLILPDQVNDVIKDIPVFVPAPDGSAVLIALQGTTISNTPDHIAASIVVAPGTNGQIILGSKLSPKGFIIKNVPVAIRQTDKTTGKVYELFLPSATADVNFIASNPIGVNWGRWTGNYVLTENGNAIPTKGDLHYIYSDQITSPAQIAALGGLLSTTTYSLAGNTTPTDPAGNALMLGTLTMTADFKAQAVTSYNVVVNKLNGAPAFNMVNEKSVPFLKPDVNGNSLADFNLVSNPLANGGCTNCTGGAAAAFVGNQAQGVITTYAIGDPVNPAIGVNGAAVLTRP